MSANRITSVALGGKTWSRICWGVSAATAILAMSSAVDGRTSRDFRQQRAVSSRSPTWRAVRAESQEPDVVTALIEGAPGHAPTSARPTRSGSRAAPSHACGSARTGQQRRASAKLLAAGMRNSQTGSCSMILVISASEIAPEWTSLWTRSGSATVRAVDGFSPAASAHSLVVCS